ncbi:MAG: DNA-binding protein [Eggerthellaceae bacterium]|nr:DNA-binding protein [Eggerthellaceae bacterium]
MLTTSEAAKRLGVSQRRVVGLIHEGALDAEKRSGVWFVDEKSVQTRLRTANSKGGRPPVGRGRHDVTFTLMNRTHEVVQLVYNRARKEFVSIGEISDHKRAPLGLVHNGSMSLAGFNSWWRGRGIPQTRDNLSTVLELAHAEVPEELLYRNLGLSLSDQYWICPVDAPLRWEDINFFTNGFETSSRLTAPQFGDSAQDAHPDNTSDGNLAKHWIVHGKKRILQKGGQHNSQEPYNEVVATSLHKRLLKRRQYVPYSLGSLNGEVVCECADFLSDEEEYIPAHYVQRIKSAEPSQSDYAHYVACCEELGVYDIEHALACMMVCDDVIANHDRHWRNFGIVRNVETLECRPAPLFDSGSSLWCNVDMKTLKTGDAAFRCKPFDDRPSRQLMLVHDFSWANEKALDGFVDEALEILGQNEWITPRLPYVKKNLEHRVHRMQHIFEWE